MSKPRTRYTAQLRQEQISRSQFQERITEIGWTAAEPKDLGEDFIIHIYFDGQASGVTLHVQLKSTTKLTSDEKRRRVPCRVPVKDLIHWSSFEFPMILVVWDVGDREGRWIFIDDAIKSLDQRDGDWRERKTKVTVHLPWANDTSNEGFVRLTMETGWRLLPILLKDRTLNAHVNFVFPNSENGRKKSEDVRQAFLMNSSVQIDGENIESMVFPEWWARWFAPPSWRPAHLSIEPVSHANDLVSADIELFGRNGKSLEFHEVGFERQMLNATDALFSTKKEGCPLLIEMKMYLTPSGPKSSLRWSADTNGKRVSEAMKVLDFLRIVQSGGIINITFTDWDNAIFRHEFSPQCNEVAAVLISGIQKLYEIQNMTGIRLIIPDEGLDSSDLQAIDIAHQIIHTGRSTSITDRFEFPIDKEAFTVISSLAKQRERQQLQVTFEESTISVLQQEIPLGRRTTSISGFLDIDHATNGTIDANPTISEQALIALTDVRIEHIYEKWLAEADQAEESFATP